MTVYHTSFSAPAFLICSIKAALPRGPPPMSPGVTSTAQDRDFGLIGLSSRDTDATRARRFELKASPVS